ncbi:MAG: DUF2666 family protein [Candidatus Micrarchaeota archaeon]
MDEISFAAKYKEWISIKKMSIDESTSEPEIVHMLAGLCDTLNRKAFEFTRIDLAKIDEYAARLTSGKRKGFGSLAEVFGSIKSAEAKEILAGSLSGVKMPQEEEAGEGAKMTGPKALMPVAEAYLIQRILVNLWYDAGVGAESLAKAYPKLKFAKPRGRFGPAKKK